MRCKLQQDISFTRKGLNRTKPGNDFLRKLVVLSVVMFGVACGEIVGHLSSNGSTGGSPNLGLPEQLNQVDPLKDFEAICKVPPVSGTGNGSGYNGLLGYDNRTFISVDDEVICESDLLGTTNITSILTLMDDGTFVRTEGCNKENPEIVNPVELLLFSAPNTSQNFIGTASATNSYEQFSQKSCANSVPLKDKIEFVCKYKNQMKYIFYLLNDSMNYYIDEMIVVAKSAGGEIDIRTGAELYLVDVSYVSMDKYSITNQNNLPQLSLSYENETMTYAKANNMAVDNTLSGYRSAPFNMAFNIKQGASTGADGVSNLQFTYKNFSPQTMVSDQCEWK